ncbi:DUF3500 domain-containing protein [Deinococcus radiopugnans]|nr:DUF3500 domain-containing protein [Deinococcus radiopugnans]MBB6017094.1 hypothetical protein [Deinococcus radiopugnans ATCC 19172]
MNRPLISAVIAAALGSVSLLTLSLASAGGAGAPVAAANAAADAQTTKIVAAANAFLVTLSDAQKKAVMFAFTDSAQRVRWSNFPQGAFNRVGVRWGDLNTAQRAALMTLLGAVLSPAGVDMVKGQMAADEVLKTAPNRTDGSGIASSEPAGATAAPAAGAGSDRPTNPPAGGQPPAAGGASGSLPSVSFGSDNYFVSFLGTPSATTQWMMQFGGHHLAINATVVGDNVTLSPSLTGGEPVKILRDGQVVTIIPQVPIEMKAAEAMLGSLSAAQKAKAVISTTRIDLVLGPGQDGKTLQPEGLPGSAMTAAQKTLFLALIQDRLGILNADDLAVKMADIQKNLDQTSFAWWGPTTAGSSAYFRITGPTAIIEFSPQANDGDPSNHLHNMYRDPTNEYGAAWTK